MEKIVECVPNFSIGRKSEYVEPIVNAIRSAGHDVKVADYSSDVDHGRLVVTAIGEAEPVKEAVYQGVKKAIQLVDIASHEGAHPYIGAVDVIPFIPLRKATFNDCVKLRNEISEKIASELGVPVYIYGNIAKRPERKELSSVRKGGLEGVGERISTPEGRPDFGPAKLHPTAGAVAVGARDILIAYNVNLDSNDLASAREIAERTREKNSGLRGVKAIGILLDSRNTVQIAVNITNHKDVSIKQVFERIKMEAESRGVRVKSSEIIGLVPKDAVFNGMEEDLMLENWDGTRIIENFL